MQDNHTTLNPRIKDMTGQQFGRLTVVCFSHQRNDKHKRAMWRCVCECGNECVIEGVWLRSGNTKSCGCLSSDTTAERNKVDAKHYYKTQEYRSWVSMRTRCNNPNYENWSEYGGRGIKVCDRWDSFDNFLSDMGKKPTRRHTIDRIDTDGDYCPENCRWANPYQQQQNKRNNVNLTFNGETFCVREWERRLGFRNGAIRERIKHGWTVERALTQPIGTMSKYTKLVQARMGF